MITITMANIVDVKIFWLCFTRWITILINLPLFDQVGIPSTIKVLTALTFTYAFFPITRGEVAKDLMTFGQDQFWLLTILYSVIGLLISFLVKSIVYIYIAAGSLITQSIGFGAMRYFDPSLSQNIGPFETLLKWGMLTMVLSAGIMSPILKGVILTFTHSSVGKILFFSSSPQFYVDFFKSIFSASLLLASPLIFTNVLITTIMGVTTRTVPQMNILMVSFVVNIGLGLIVFYTITPGIFDEGFKQYFNQLGVWFNFLKKF